MPINATKINVYIDIIPAPTNLEVVSVVSGAIGSANAYPIKKTTSKAATPMPDFTSDLGSPIDCNKGIIIAANAHSTTSK